MNQNLQPEIMAIFGACLQWARGFKKFTEFQYHVIAVVLAFGGYILFNPITLTDWRTATIQAIIGTAGNATSLWGGTFLASNSAKAGLAVFPVTDSK